MKLLRLNMLAGFALAAVLSMPAWATRTATPGTMNYVEGDAAIGSLTLDSKSIGSAEVQPGQSLDTENGKAEMLLTPGVFLRAGDNSSVKLISPSLIDTRVAVVKGEAMIEVAELHPENDIRVMEDGISTRLVKTGVYDFDANHNQVRVFAGQADVQDGDRQVKVKSGHEVALNSGEVTKARKFNEDQAKESDLYRWSSLRSSYLAEANMDAARTYAVNGWYGPGWMGAGWYWDPWFASYTFIPGGGFLYSPFGWGFYSPLWAYRMPFYGGFGYFHHFGAGYHPVFADRGHFTAHAPVTGYRSAGRVSGFRGGNAGAPTMSARSFGGYGGGFGGFHGGFGGRR